MRSKLVVWGAIALGTVGTTLMVACDNSTEATPVAADSGTSADGGGTSDAAQDGTTTDGGQDATADATSDAASDGGSDAASDAPADADDAG